MDHHHSLKPGDRCGNYQVLHLLGKGGMGEVYLAKSLFLDRIVALKTVPLRLRDREDVNERFGREARALSRINHANVVAILDGGITEDNVVYLVMEYLEGMTLREYMRRKGAIPIDLALSFGAQIADANAAIHAAKILHRDNKPENTFILKGGLVKLIDFGLARIRDNAAQTTVKPIGGNGPLGTVHYMAPEQLLAEGEVTEKADVYAIAMIVWESIAGLYLFQFSTSEFPAAAVVQRNHQLATPRRLKDVAPRVPDELSDLLDRGLSKDPHLRPTAREMAMELRAIFAKFTGGALPAAPGEAQLSKPSAASHVLSRSRAIVGRLFGARGVRAGTPAPVRRPSSALRKPAVVAAREKAGAVGEELRPPHLAAKRPPGLLSHVWMPPDTAPDPRWRPYTPTDPEAPKPTDFVEPRARKPISVEGNQAESEREARLDSVRTDKTSRPALESARTDKTGTPALPSARTDKTGTPVLESARTDKTGTPALPSVRTDKMIIPVFESVRTDKTSAEAPRSAPAWTTKLPAHDSVTSESDRTREIGRRQAALRWVVLGVVALAAGVLVLGVLRMPSRVKTDSAISAIATSPPSPPSSFPAPAPSGTNVAAAAVIAPAAASTNDRAEGRSETTALPSALPAVAPTLTARGSSPALPAVASKPVQAPKLVLPLIGDVGPVTAPTSDKSGSSPQAAKRQADAIKAAF